MLRPWQLDGHAGIIGALSHWGQITQRYPVTAPPQQQAIFCVVEPVAQFLGHTEDNQYCRLMHVWITQIIVVFHRQWEGQVGVARLMRPGTLRLHLKPRRMDAAGSAPAAYQAVHAVIIYQDIREGIACDAGNRMDVGQTKLFLLLSDIHS